VSFWRSTLSKLGPRYSFTTSVGTWPNPSSALVRRERTLPRMRPRLAIANSFSPRCRVLARLKQYAWVAKTQLSTGSVRALVCGSLRQFATTPRLRAIFAEHGRNAGCARVSAVGARCEERELALMVAAKRIVPTRRTVKKGQAHLCQGSVAKR
jgi:hypothetical protein